MGQQIFHDRIYGAVKISSPAILDLIKSKPLQRLKRIAQFGIPDKYYHLKNYSRFEHSLGVMMLLQKLGASEEEQVAGLLHDVSHSAFSHVIDWVVGDGDTEDFQDKAHRNFIDRSEIAGILKKYSFDPSKISNYKKFKLLERPIPDLCADRVDYSLRELSLNMAKRCFKSMTAFKNKIVFKDKEAALLFAKGFLQRQIVHWGDFEAVSRYRLLADILRKALEKKIIKFEDFWTTDSEVIKKLVKSKDLEIKKVLKVLENKSLSHLPKSNQVFHKKFRFVDPQFLVNGKLVRLSLVDKQFKKELKKARKENKKGVAIPYMST